jgi:ATP-dependent RNA helicase DDX10/DBP4
MTARSLDFPSVDCVVQVDASEDVDTYIHGVRGTAHCESSGSSFKLLLLVPSEEQGMKSAIEKTSIEMANSNNVYVLSPRLFGDFFCSYEGSGFRIL